MLAVCLAGFCEVLRCDFAQLSRGPVGGCGRSNQDDRVRTHVGIHPRIRVCRTNDVRGDLYTDGGRSESPRYRYGVRKGLLLDFGLVEGNEDDDECGIDPLGET